MTQAESNPLIETPALRHGAVPFDRIQTEHFLPALDHAITVAEERIEEIVSQDDAPTFANTLVPLEALSDERVGNTTAL